MNHGNDIMVIGGDSTLGAATCERLAAHGVPVIRTSRRETPGSHHLDLANLSPSWRPPQGVRVAILCAAITSIEKCRHQPQLCRTINVDAIERLGRELLAAGARVIFLSTNMVFDGTVPHAQPNDVRAPQTAYGRLKAEAEDRLLSLGCGVTILRMTKVIAHDVPLFMQWGRSLRAGEIVRPLSDLVIAPISIDFAVHAIIGAASRSTEGLLHASASHDVTYADAARYLARRWGASPELIQPCAASDSDVVLEHLPRHTTLDGTALRDQLGLPRPDPYDALGILTS